MPIQISEEASGKITVFRLTGTLVKSDYNHLACDFDRLVRRIHGKLRVLLDMTQFDGWEPAAIWDEAKFDVKHFSKMERLAAVGDKKWEAAVVDFAKPFTPAKVRYFDHAEAAAAHAWLLER